MKNGIKQLFRTPLKTSMLFLLLSISTILFVIGLNLWMQVTKKLSEVDKTFVTIGTVTQKENSMSSKSQWDAALKGNIYFEEPVYTKCFPVDVLTDCGVNYISGPEQRPYLGAVSPDFIATSRENRTYDTQTFIGEISPLQDAIPDKPIEVKVEKVLWGNTEFLGSTIFFCDHTTEYTHELKRGKNYFVYVTMNPFNSDIHTELKGTFEYMPVRAYKEQPKLWYEVSHSFYESKDWKIWEGIIADLERQWMAVPVVPTSDMKLINAFHSGEAVITEGRTINKNEFVKGKRVCLIPQSFAELNRFQVGDSFEMQFYFADYGHAVTEIAQTVGGIDVSDLKPNGEPYSVFQTDKYEIVGIYSYMVRLTDDHYALGTNEIFVPSASVTGNVENNVLEKGPMQGYNTSFMIENGTINQALEKIQQLPESDFLEIQFDDNGYEQIASDLKNTKLIAGMLLVAGFALGIVVVIFILYFLVISQKWRLAIERALGTSKKQCVISLLSGIMILAIVSLLFGAIVGDSLTEKVQKMASVKTQSFDMDYTKGVDSADVTLDDLGIRDNQVIIWESFTIVVAAVFICILSLCIIVTNLRIAPIYLLGKRDE